MLPSRHTLDRRPGTVLDSARRKEGIGLLMIRVIRLPAPFARLVRVFVRGRR